ncbi:MAG: SGNH/GDSL hydrolase family protein [Planctomycetota bacterium]|jgi:hypothetical protein|nr:SGNH/GDSL hydrolase family protein [Planctomycetota bacterium]
MLRGHPRTGVPGGDLHRVRVALPWSAACTVRRAELAPGAIIHDVPRASGSLLVLGDSISQGMTSSGMMGSYAWRLAQLQGLTLFDAAVGGHRFDVNSLCNDIPIRGDIVTVAYGTNDWSSGAAHDEILAEAEAYLTALRTIQPHDPIVLISPIWRVIDEPERFADFCQLGAKLLDLARRMDGVHAVDGLQLMACSWWRIVSTAS